MINRLMISLELIALLSVTPGFAQTLWLDELDLSTMAQSWGSPQVKKSVDGNPLTVAGQHYVRGVGTHAISTLLLKLDGKAKRFSAMVGVDDEANKDGTINFFVIGDKKILWESGKMRKGDVAKKVDVDLVSVKKLGLLVTDADDGINYDHADWCDAKLELNSPVKLKDIVDAPVKIDKRPYILTPKESPKPRINGAKVFGARPGNPFLYSIPASGNRPMEFKTSGLPEGLSLDPKTGSITGTVEKKGEYSVMLHAANSLGTSSRSLKIVIGDHIALTPPMGWNSWNCWAGAVSDEKVRTSADAMVTSGLINHGWSFINIDDCWEIKPKSNDPMLSGEPRVAKGFINTNKKFPDMKKLADYVHGLGLKIGIYSSPGPLTCAGFTASYQFEEQDAQRYAEWGIDYLKYDWCSYSQVAPKNLTREDYKKPYVVMRVALDKVKRDIVYSLCQYGMDKVWEWGSEVGGNCWRTTGDITDTWSSMSEIGFAQADHAPYGGPGHWNDPDMLVVGLVGWGPQLRPSRLTPDEQYTHISLWSLLASPLLIGCDLARLDEFTKNLLMNDEIIEVNQDPLGKQAKQIFNKNARQIWVKEMENGSKTIGFFYADRGKGNPVDYLNWDAAKSVKIALKGSDIGIQGSFKVRDLWRQKNLGSFKNEFTAEVPYHGVVLVNVTQ
ncbi:MAG: NPCBM/NEW2 domain-containing protein [bacterium]